MSQTTSREVRAAIVRAKAQKLSYDEIAELLGVGRATVSRTLRLQRETGDVARRPKGGGNFSIFRDRIAELLLAIVETMPDATVMELTRAFEKQSDLKTSRAAVGRALARMGYSRKKRPSERQSAKRCSDGSTVENSAPGCSR
jgi:transposase